MQVHISGEKYWRGIVRAAQGWALFLVLFVHEETEEKGEPTRSFYAVVSIEGERRYLGLLGKVDISIT